jgi:hypothetical protein
MAPQPASKIDAHFPITATIWRNENTEGRAWYSATVERRYKDRDGNHQTTNSFSGDELLTVGEVSRLAFGEIARLRAADRAAQVDAREPGAEG